jgi:hypothetical protein
VYDDRPNLPNTLGYDVPRSDLHTERPKLPNGGREPNLSCAGLHAKWPHLRDYTSLCYMFRSELPHNS